MNFQDKRLALRAAAGLGASVIALTIAVEARAEAAASDAGEVADVVVTARKRNEKLQDVPISVAAVGGQMLATQKIDRVTEYAAKVPNFTALQQNTRVSGLYIRGIGGNANTDGSESGVGLIVDNVFYTHVGFSWADFTDLQSIEVVRGPQGTLLGKNTTIGAVVINTAQPTFSPEASISGTYGNYDRKQVRAVLNGPIFGNVLAGRLTVSGDNTDGWITNHYNGQKLLDTNRYAVRGQLLFEPNGDFKDRLIFESLGSAEYNNFYPPSGDPTTYTNGATRNGWQTKLKNLFGYMPSYDTRNNANLDSQGQTISRILGASNQFDWRFSGYTLTSITAWRKLVFRPHNDSDGTPFPIFRQGYDVDVNQYSQELRLASPTGGKLEYQVGLYGLRETVASNNRYLFYSDASLFFLGANAPAILNGVEYDQGGETRVFSGAAFGQGAWRITDKASLAAGVRVTNEDRTASNHGYTFGGATLPALYNGYRYSLLNALGGIFLVKGHKDNTSVSWLINPSYKFSNGTLAYVSVSQGEKSGAANLGAVVGNPVITRPEKSTDYEIGLKNTFLGGKAYLNANLYWNDIEDYQASQTLGASTASYLTNVGKARLRGFEVDGRWQATADLTLSASGAINDARYVDYKDAPSPQELRGTTTKVDLSGQRLPGASLYSGQVSLDYQHPLPGNLAVFGYATQTYKSKTQFISDSSYGHQGAYGLTNAGIGVKTAENRYAVSVWAKNLFDQKYILAAGTATSLTPYISILGDPRTFGVTFTAKAF
ncbi:MAG: TonB-dependent receptor [Caulobacteraceae bacterium]|nr:TonB-dependent receptor [Caulobacteraceae bacterium]